jgi:hypothetical protein
VQRHRAEHAIVGLEVSELPIAAAAAFRFAVVLRTPLGSPPTVAVNCTTAGPESIRLAMGARL